MRRQQTEAKLQAAFLAAAKLLGVYARKVKCSGHRGFPDVFLAYRGEVALVELKTLRGRTSYMQENEIFALRQQKVNVAVLYSYEDALPWLSRWVELVK